MNNLYYVHPFLYVLACDCQLRRLANPSFEESLYRNEAADHGGKPFITKITQDVKRNKAFRQTIWTGEHLQVTLMNLDVGEDIGLEQHLNVDQFLRIEGGRGLVQMGPSKGELNVERYVSDGFAIIVPAGTWHNITNVGRVPLKLYSIYAPPEHPFGTVHKTKIEAEMAEEE